MKQIEDIFLNFDHWRDIPNYQMERRADIFFAAYLPEVLSRHIGPMGGYIVPELPLKKKNSNLSFKVDYVIATRWNRELVLVELKTDTRSIRLNQIAYLIEAASQSPRTLVDDIVAIAKASRAKAKYGRLLSYLSDLGISFDHGHCNRCDPTSCRIVLIMPKKVLPKNAKLLIESSGVRFDIIDFREFAEVVAEHQDEMSTRFAQSLITWSTPHEY